MRPISLDRKPVTERWRSWESFCEMMGEFLGPAWRERRNKVKSLREALRHGPKATENFMKLYRLDRLPQVSKVSSGDKSGWEGRRCVYFDAIEAMDLFFPLEPLAAKKEAKRQ